MLLNQKQIHVFTDLISGLFVLVFAYTAISKLQDPATFRASMEASVRIADYASWLTYFIPWTELLVVVLLIIPGLRSWGLMLSAILMTVFTIYVLLVLSQATGIPCSCGGIVSELSWTGHLWVNSILTGIAVATLLLNFTFFIAIKQDKPNTWKKVGIIKTIKN